MVEPDMMPHDHESEVLLVGACLRDQDAFPQAHPIVKRDDFHDFAHQKLWEAFADLASRGIGIDAASVHDWLRDKKMTGDVSSEYLVELYRAGASHNFVHLARNIRKSAAYRDLARTCQAAFRMAMERSGEPEEIQAGLEQRLIDISDRTHQQQPVTLSEVITETLDVLTKRKLVREGECDGDSIMSGWASLDKMTGGFFQSEMTVLAARPSIGKTLVALCIADFAASCGRRVLIASVEQRRTELGERLLSRRSGVSSYIFRTADFNKEQESAMLEASHGLRELQIVIDDPPVQDVLRIASNARRMQMRGGIDMLIVDYLQIVFPQDERGNRNEQVAAISRGLKRIARELKIPVIALAQLNRGSEHRGGECPKLSDLRESGSIEQDADTVIILHKTEEYPEVEPIEFHIKKQRNGPRGVVTLQHHKRTFDIKETVL